MKYSKTELQYEDIMWFGVDKNGCIFECTTGGEGNVPAFVRDSKENTELLADYFLNSLPHSSPSKLLIPDDASPLAEDSKNLSGKGIFCFDTAVEENRPHEYKKIAAPDIPLKLSALPDNIRKILENHKVDADVKASGFINVPHCF